MQVIPHSHSVQEILNETSWLRDTWHGCENLGTAYKLSTKVAVPRLSFATQVHVKLFNHGD